MVLLANLGEVSAAVLPSERIAQLVVCPVLRVKWTQRTIYLRRTEVTEDSEAPADSDLRISHLTPS